MIRCLAVLALSLAIALAESIQCRNGTDFVAENDVKVKTSLEKYEGALLLFLGFGSISIILAVVYTLIRRYVFQDVNNLDSTFDAGGNVSTSLTAVTLASQMLWPGDLMQSVTVCVKYGIAGAFWYCASSILNISLFPILSVKFKTRAPGAKTYLQIIRARFGTPTHAVFICFALLVNVVILASIIVGSITVLQATISDVSPEFCVLVLACLCGSYALIGGLGSTFYVSYFNAATTFLVLSIFVIKIIYSEDKPFGSLKEIYELVNCQPGISGNRAGSRITFLSEDAMIFAVQALFLSSSITYCDQASWQSRIAAKPLQGALGFLIGAYLWFSVPATIGLVAGVTYVSEAARNASFALSIGQIDSGVVSAYMAEKAMGAGGAVMMLTMLTMLTMSTGSGEIMGISSVIVYDIYQVYIRPFRRYIILSTYCICCGLERQEPSEKQVNKSRQFGHKCVCPPVFECHQCSKDISSVFHADKSPGKVVQYSCPHHGAFRMYQDSLVSFKNWCMLWVAVALIPFGLVLNAIELDLNWTMLTGIIFTVPSLPGVILSILWVKTTSTGMIVGSLIGLAAGSVADILVAVYKYEWEGGFLRAMSAPYSVLAGCGTGFFISLSLTIIISSFTHKIQSEEDEYDVWQKLRDIDNPLHPWSYTFGEEFPEITDGTYRPSEKEMDHVSRYGKYASIIGSIVIFLVFIVIVPSSLATLEVLSFDEFEVWAKVITIMLFVSTVAIILVTPMEEIKAIFTQLRRKKSAEEQGSLSRRTSMNSIASNVPKSFEESITSDLMHKRVAKVARGKDNEAFRDREMTSF